jgi:hypothetical protein
LLIQQPPAGVRPRRVRVVSSLPSHRLLQQQAALAAEGVAMMAHWKSTSINEEPTERIVVVSTECDQRQQRHRGTYADNNCDAINNNNLQCNFSAVRSSS